MTVITKLCLTFTHHKSKTNKNGICISFGSYLFITYLLTHSLLKQILSDSRTIVTLQKPRR